LRKQPRTPHGALSIFAVARTSLDRAEDYMLSIIGESRVGTSPRPVMATRLIVAEEQLRAAGWNAELP
jgi:hypothetical protein